MREMTSANLAAAFAGESQAHMRYLIFAAKAESEGLTNVARLFRAIAYAEQVHATNHFKTLGNLGPTTQNLGAAIGGETFEVNEMYPAYVAVAELQGEKGAQRSANWALEAEKIHAAMYETARQATGGNHDASIDAVHICDSCGYTIEGEAPERCPVCGATRDHFVKF